MKKLLVINATPDKETSHTYFIYRRLISKMNLEGYNIKELDLFDMHLPMQDNTMVKARYGVIEKRDIDLETDKLVDEFTDSDAFIFISPTWNLTIPNVLKNYLDIVLVARHQFKYEGHKRIDLVNEKKALILNTGGCPIANNVNYLDQTCNFIDLVYHVCHIDGTGHKYPTYDDMLLDVTVAPNFFQK